MVGNIEVYIGPNGFGKTTKLRDKKKELVVAGVSEEDILFVESEIALGDEVKDTLDNSIAMEYIVFDLLGKSPRYLAAKTEFEDSVDEVIGNSVNRMNAYVDEVLGLNDQTRTNDFISCGDKAYKKMVKIDQSELKNKIGSGQRMQLILRLACSSSKTVLFLDEPEKYSHPSMLHETAGLINEFAASPGKSVYIATHSPKLLTMLAFEYEDLYIINDATHAAKSIEFDTIASELTVELATCLPQISDYEKRYYANGDSLKSMVIQAHHRDFLEAMFTRRLFLCEGIYDEVFIGRALTAFGHSLKDYCILRTNGKFPMPALARIFGSLGVDLFLCFDKDNETQNKHAVFNAYLRDTYPLSHYCFDPRIEEELGFTTTNDKNKVALLMEHLETFTFDPKYNFY